ncbi:MAG TPA: MFS transporter [Streptosporangiaceae bacterium]
MRGPVRPPVLLSYIAFVLVGVSAGVSGVLLVPQMRDYGVDRAIIGITFFTNSAGFVLASLTSGALIHRFGVRIALTVGGITYVLSALYLATRPPFAAFVLVQVVLGYGTGMLESGLNAYLAALPEARTLLNRLHAFFGVGALIGPALAAWITGFASWPVVWLVLAVACVPLVAGFLLAYPRPRPADPAAGAAEAAGIPAAVEGSMMRAALRERGVLLGAAMLAVYVGIELGVGNWAFSYLVQARALSGSLAGWSVSGYWLGLTLGRFLISPVAVRIGATTARMMYACLIGVTAATLLAWLSPTAGLASASLVLLGFFLGPIFPTTMGAVAQLTPPRLAPTAIGVLNAASLVGGAALPWLAGTIAQNTGIWIILPFAVALAVLQFIVWRPLASRVTRSIAN